MADSIVSAGDINEFLVTHLAAQSFTCTAVGWGWAEVALVPGHERLRPGHILNGATIFDVCDGALYAAVFTVAGLTPMAVTTELSIRFVAPVMGEQLTARATIDKPGRRSMVGTIRAWTTDESTPVAVAQGSYAMPATEPELGWE